MTWTVFGALTAPTLPELDANFYALANLSVVQGALSGTNTITFTPTTEMPTLTAYALNQVFAGVAAGTNTGAVTVNAGSLGALPVYKDTVAGPVALAGGEIYTGNYAGFAYDVALNGGAGGFHLLHGVTVNALSSVANGLTAAGSTQGTALAITAQTNVVTTTAASTGVILADIGVGAVQEVFNEGANTLSIYPASGGQIDALGANAAYSLATVSVQVFRQTATGATPQWYSYTLA